MELEKTYLFVIVGTIVLSMIIMAFTTANNIVLSKKQKARFSIVFSLIAFVALLDMATTLIELSKSSHPILLPLEYMFNALGFGLSPLIPLLIADIAYKNKTSKFIIPFWAVYFIVIQILISQDLVFTYTPNDGYSRVNAGFIVYLVFYYLSVLLLFINLVLLSREMISKTPYLLFVLFFFLIAGTLVQVFINDIHVTYLIVCIVSIIYYDYISSLWSQIDGLTGLFSQYTFMNRCKIIKPGTAILFFDCDSFKEINDTYGHLIGDNILKEVARILQFTFKRHGRCYRIGGDEFAVILNPNNNIEELISLFHENIAKTKDSNIPYVSCGYAIYDKNMDIEEVKKIADDEMYLMKKNRKEQMNNVK